MDVASYLARQRERLGAESKRIKDFSVFEFRYIPPQPLMRDECRTLIDEMLRFEMSGLANHQAIIGSRGSGKTLSVKYLAGVLGEHADLEVLYANCRHHNTSFKVLAHLLNVQARGASMTELFDRFCARCNRKTVVVLDEIDLMSPKDKRREILYLLSRAEQPFMVVMLSNRPQILQELDAATRSSLQPWQMHFRNYDAGQIRKILDGRASAGLREWDGAVLSEIAALTTRFSNSDARVAIKTLEYAVTRSGSDVRTCFENARRDLVVDMINDLSDSALMILWAVVNAKRNLAREIHDRYRRFCETHGERPFSYAHFSSHLGYLQSTGLVMLESTKVNRAYSHRVVPLFDTSTAEQICKLRFDK